MLILFTGALLGYKFAKYNTEREPVPSITQGDVVHEVIKEIDVGNKSEVLELSKSKINIKRDYTPNNSDGISVLIVASNGFSQSTVKDYIKYPALKERDYTYEIVGGCIIIVATAILTTYTLSKTGMLRNSGMSVRF
jgi:hypothetical protein